MSDITRGDIDRLHDAIQGSEQRLGARIDAQRLESDTVYVRKADLALVEQKADNLAEKLDTLAAFVRDTLGRKDSTRKAILVQAFTFVSGVIYVILAQSGVFK